MNTYNPMSRLPTTNVPPIPDLGQPIQSGQTSSVGLPIPYLGQPSQGISPLTENSVLRLNNSKDNLLLKLRFLLELKTPLLPEDLIKTIIEIYSFPDTNNLIQQIRTFLEKK